MSLKRIIALASGGPGDVVALAFAASIAGQHDGVAEILPIYPDTATDMIALGLTMGATLSPQAIEELAAAEREIHARIETVAREAANEADVVYGAGDGAPRLSVGVRGLRPGHALALEASLADLVVIAQRESEAGYGRDLLAQALLSDGAPVLIARGEPDQLSGVAVIAWDGSAQAGRAVRAALPLLAMAGSIHVLQCMTGLDRALADPDIDGLNTYLKLHGVGEALVTMVEGEDEGIALLAAAKGKQAGLLVAGAWGHSRLREAIFGGATRTFLREGNGPSLLLAH